MSTRQRAPRVRARFPLLWIVSVALGLALGACSTPPETVTKPRDASAPEGSTSDLNLDGEVPLTLAPGGVGAKELAAPLAAGQVRAGKITAKDALLSGIKVEGKVGDFKIYNDRVAFVIAGARATNGYSPFGGELLDAQHLVGGKAKSAGAGRSLLGETILGIGAKALEVESVGVINDGSDGQPAMVRVIGAPAPFPLLSSILPSVTFAPVHVVVDYVLAKDSNALEMRWRFFNKLRRDTEIPMALFGFLAGDGLDFYAQKVGFEIKTGGVGEIGWVGLVGDEISYGILARGSSTLKPLATYSGVWAVSCGTVPVPAAGETTLRYEVVVAGGSPEALARALRERRGDSEPSPLSGVVKDPAGAPVADARVHVLSDDGSYVTMAKSDDQGRYSLGLAPGSYTLRVVSEGRAPTAAEAITMGPGPKTQDLAVPAQATLTFSVLDDEGKAIPAKLIFKPTKAPAALPASFGELRYPGGAARVVFHTGGKGSTTLPPGDYTITASRGFEYEIDKKAITVAAGDKKDLSFTLAHSVDTTGYMCGDFHLHAMWSPDSSDLYEHKVASFVAEGLELPVATDHEYITDYNPVIAQMGLGKWVYGIIGEELTTFAYGHFNPYPVVLDTTKPNNGALPWMNRSPPQLFGDVRAAWPNAVFEINHPRSSPIAGYFNYVGYDAANGKVRHPDQWSLEFDALEVFNDSGWNANKGKTVRDWFSLLDRGKRTTAVGNSDSHNSLNTEVGYPRNYIKLSTDEPGKLNLVEFAQAVKNQRMSVSGGPFVTVAIGNKGMGDTVDATSKKVTVKIKVQAPTWVPVDTLRIFIGGKDGGDEIETLTLDASTADPQNPVVRYDDSVEISLSKDTWLIVVVQGKGTLDPVVRGGEPFAVTNPIFLDVDGNGKYDPPFSFPQ